MRVIIKTLSIIILIAVNVFSQHDTKGCHVYTVDTALAEKMMKRLNECEKNPARCGIVEFPAFIPVMGEEELTTKTYKFSWNSLTITANVFFTDETLASSKGSDSVVMTITLAHGSPKGVQADENSAQAEFSLVSNADAMRVKRYYRVDGKQYLVGLDCHFKDKSDK
jgi:hypothetical protein